MQNLKNEDFSFLCCIRTTKTNQGAVSALHKLRNIRNILLFFLDFFLSREAFPRFLLNVSDIVFMMCRLLSRPAARRSFPFGSQ